MSGFSRKASGRKPGDIFAVSSSSVPRGALAARGRLLSAAAHPKLFAAIGHRYSAGGAEEVSGMFRMPGSKDSMPQQANQLRHDYLTYDTQSTSATHSLTDTGYSAKEAVVAPYGATKWIHVRYPRIVHKASEAGQRAICLPFRLFMPPNGLADDQEFSVNVGFANALAAWSVSGTKLVPACNYIKFSFVSNTSSITLTSAVLTKCAGGTEVSGQDVTSSIVKEWVGDSYYISLALMMAANYGEYTVRNSDNTDTTQADPAGTFNTLDGFDVCPFFSYERAAGSEQIAFNLEWLFDSAMESDDAPGITLRPPARNLCDWPEYQTGLGPDTSADDEAGQQYQNAWWTPLMTNDPTYLTGRRNELFLWCVQDR